jgi:hypothetical protein
MPLEGFTIVHVAVVAVEKGAVLPDQTVVIAGERILRVAPDGATELPTTTHSVDGSGLYLMPGLVDAHVHFFDPPVFGRLMLANGVLLVRDMGQVTQDVLKTRAELNAGTLLGPEMIATGYLLDGVPPLIPPIALGLATPDEGRAAVRQQAQAGVDQIKVYSALEKDVYLAILDEAQKLGIQAVGHVPETVYIEDAVAAGQRSIEHLFGFDKLIGKLLGLPITLRAGGMGSDARYWPRLQEVDHAAPQSRQTAPRRKQRGDTQHCELLLTCVAARWLRFDVVCRGGVSVVDLPSEDRGAGAASPAPCQNGDAQDGQRRDADGHPHGRDPGNGNQEEHVQGGERGRPTQQQVQRGVVEEVPAGERPEKGHGPLAPRPAHD